MSETNTALRFQEVPGLLGVRKAEYRLPESGEDVLILATGPHTFHVLSARQPQSSGETVVINISKESGASIFGVLLDWLTSAPKKAGKFCWTITVITAWPNNVVTVESSTRCEPV
jgi:hypothetical protein